MAMSNTIDDNYTYHVPTEDAAKLHEAIRNEGKRFAHLINDELPPSREKSLAQTKLEEATMWANAAIARHISATGNEDDSNANG